MSATLAIRHHVRDYAAWRKVYDEVEPLRAQHGCTAQRVMRLPDDGNDLFVTHDFPSAERADGFAHDPALQEAMGRAGVDGPPRIEIFTDV
jgi:quinol monooxygenase YgiN